MENLVFNTAYICSISALFGTINKHIDKMTAKLLVMIREKQKKFSSIIILQETTYNGTFFNSHI